MGRTRRNRSRRRGSRRHRYRGGGASGTGAAAWIESNYGGADKQYFNALSQNGPTAGSQSNAIYNMTHKAQAGGRRRRRGRKGGSLMAAAANAVVPASLFAAAMWAKNRSRRGSRKFRGGSGGRYNNLTPLSPAPY
jgi:hypothetical protein